MLDIIDVNTMVMNVQVQYMNTQTFVQNMFDNSIETAETIMIYLITAVMMVIFLTLTLMIAKLPISRLRNTVPTPITSPANNIQL